MELVRFNNNIQKEHVNESIVVPGKTRLSGNFFIKRKNQIPILADLVFLY